jgi:hypothetical protein
VGPFEIVAQKIEAACLGPTYWLIPNTKMKKALGLLLAVWLAVPAAWAANFYVRSSIGSSGDGSDWNKAWKDTSNINWGALSGGDTVYFAGGTYGQLRPTKGGGAGSPISFVRARASESGASGAAGWQAGFDSTVIFQAPSGSVAIYLYDKKDNLTFDGKVPGGFECRFGNGGKGGGCEIDGPASSQVTFRNIKTIGPGKITQSGDCRGFNLTPSALGTGGKGMSNVTMSNCEVATSGDTNVIIASAGGTDNFLMEYCLVHGADAINAATYHPNEIYCGTLTNSTFRWNKVYDIGVEGLFFNDPGNANVRVYGNLFYWGTSTNTGARGLEFNKTGNSGVLVYQNVFVDLPIGVQAGKDAASFSGCEFANNIFWNTSLNTKTGWTSSYNYFSYARSEPNSIQNGPDPFLNRASFDYHLKSNASARGAGKNLGSPYNVDLEGRTQNNPPDMGAYASGGAAPTPTATPSPTASPSPSASPSPTATPTPPPPSTKFTIGETVTPTAQVNVRSTPAGTLLGTHQPGDTGVVIDGPTAAMLNGTLVQWWDINWNTPPSGWSGEDDLTGTGTPSPTPAPTPTPPGPTPSPSPVVVTVIVPPGVEVKVEQKP